jgi:corrinoid protein of di/trimethylamine methyltransferase
LLSKEEILKKLAECVVNGEEDECEKWAKEALEAGIDAYEAIMGGCAEGMKIVSRKYEEGEYYVPEILLSASAMYRAVDVLKPHIKVERLAAPGTVVLGVVEGDIHDIGKNLVKTMLEAAGFKVVDLGKDVSPDRFVEAVREHGADVIGMSALMTTTMPEMKKVIEKLEEAGLRSKVSIVIGGAPTSIDYAQQIGADSWAKDASAAIPEVQKLISQRK